MNIKDIWTDHRKLSNWILNYMGHIEKIKIFKETAIVMQMVLLKPNHKICFILYFPPVTWK